MLYQIMCRVSGGVTGTRQSWLKHSSGQTMQFRSKEKAEEMAEKCRNRPRLKHSPAEFEYTVVQMK